MIGINPGLQEKFREKQMAEHRRLVERQAETHNEGIQKRMVSARNKVMKQYNIDPNRYPMKVFCSWKCVRKNSRKTSHRSKRFDIDTLITLCSGDTGLPYGK